MYSGSVKTQVNVHWARKKLAGISGTYAPCWAVLPLRQHQISAPRIRHLQMKAIFLLKALLMLHSKEAGVVVCAWFSRVQGYLEQRRIRTAGFRPTEGP